MSVSRNLAVLLLPLLLLLSGCDSAEERAEGHYQKALELIAADDFERARIEFRNVFKLNGTHVEARETYAKLLRERGVFREALGQYLLLAEQAPQNAAAHREVTDLALRMGDFESAKIHAPIAYKLAPEDPMIRALKASVDYRLKKDVPAALEMARGVLDEAPGNIPAALLLVADQVGAGDLTGALDLIDATLAVVPQNEELRLTRLSLLERMGDMEAIGAELAQMITLFPDNPGVRDAMVQYHLRQGDLDAAEALLRETAAQAAPGQAQPALNVVQFLYQLRSADAARAELDTLVAGAEDPRPYLRARAGLDFSEGRQQEAITQMRRLLEGAEPSDATRDLQIALAQMLVRVGVEDEAAGLVDTVLAGDGGHVEALKLRARRAITQDRPEDAISDMRRARDAAPGDAEILTIMAQAHEREGARDLMGERLALAVEVSGGGAAEALRYADYLMQEERVGPAEDVITDALRRAPDDPALLNMLGRIHVAREDWVRVDQVATILRGLDIPQANAMADALTSQSLRGQGRVEDNLSFLGDLAGASGENTEAMGALVRAQVAQGNFDAARAYLDDILRQAPDNLAARLLRAGLEASAGELDAAETRYRLLITEEPELAQSYQALFVLLSAQGRMEEAETALDIGLEAARNPSELQFSKAGLLEARGDVAGAIAIYEALYAREAGSLVLANNLASLLTHDGPETPPEQIDRAFAIAKRLRAAPSPFFQDTYGWILFLRGDAAGALPHLDQAAAALADNPQVLYHRAEALFALTRKDEARAAYEAALAAAEASGGLFPQAEAAQARLDALSTP